MSGKRLEVDVVESIDENRRDSAGMATDGHRCTRIRKN
jgi:hypothetical protein